MVGVIESIHFGQLIAQDRGEVTVAIVDPAGIVCTVPAAGGGTSTRPAVAGDVYSVQPGGSVEARPAGTNGPYERALPEVAALVWAPKGKAGPAYKMPYTAKVPNV